MNKLVRLLSIFTLSASMAFWSCKGDVGPIGPAGTNGKDGAPGTPGAPGAPGTNGNANVQAFQKTVQTADWAQVDRPGVGNGTTSKWGGVKLESTLIKADSYVTVFYVSGENKVSVPTTIAKDLDGSTEYLEYSFKTGQADVFYRAKLFNGSSVYVPSGAITFEVVAVQKTLAAAMEKSGVNLKSYNEIMTYTKKNNINILK